MTHKSLSTKAQNGSSRSSSSRSSGSSDKKSHKHSSSRSSKESVERYVQDERDYRSHAVQEYDACQEASRREHSERLRDVVRRV
jgi:hypothetical protein